MTREQHLLVKVMEECSEIAQNCAKALLFGMQEHLPGDDETNRESIIREYNDLVGVMGMLGLDVVSRSRVRAKRVKVEHYMEVSRGYGTLVDMSDPRLSTTITIPAGTFKKGTVLKVRAKGRIKERT